MITSDSVAKLIPALIAAQREFTPALKDALNPHFKSRYCDLAGCWDSCRSGLFNHGLTVVQTTLIDPRLSLLTTLYHESGEFFRFEYPLAPTKNDPQGLAACITYARRYSLMAALGLAPEDDDGEASSGRSGANGQSGNHANGNRKPSQNAARHEDSNQSRQLAPPQDKSNGHAAKSWGEVLEGAITHWHSCDPIADGGERTNREHRIAHDLISSAITEGKIDEDRICKPAEAGKDPKRDPAKVWDAAKWLYGREPLWVRQAIMVYLNKKQAELQHKAESTTSVEIIGGVELQRWAEEIGKKCGKDLRGVIARWGSVNGMDNHPLTKWTDDEADEGFKAAIEYLEKIGFDVKGNPLATAGARS